jgi:arylsulfatase A-like enzyme
MASVTGMDQSIGRLLDLLSELQIAERTLVIFLSDNGAGTKGSNRPLRGGKADMWEGGIRVPCILRYPNVVPAGSVSDSFLTALEIVPTALHVAGVEKPADLILDGHNMMPVLSASKSSVRDKMFWQRRQHKAARVRNWKWIQADGESSLYDLGSDIGEEHDLSETQPQRAVELAAQFDAWRLEMETAAPRGPFRDY